MSHRMLSVPEVAARFEVTSQTVRNWIAAGRLAAVQVTRRGRFRIPPDALRAFELDAGLSDPDGSTEATPSGSASAEQSTWRGSAGPETIEVELARVVGAIVAAVHPQAIFLFGSRARGDSGRDSDFDLAIIAPDGSERRRIARQAYDSIAAVRDRSVGADIVVLTPSIISMERDLVGSIVRTVVREGVPVYGAADLSS